MFGLAEAMQTAWLSPDTQHMFVNTQTETFIYSVLPANVQYVWTGAVNVVVAGSLNLLLLCLSQ